MVEYLQSEITAVKNIKKQEDKKMGIEANYNELVQVRIDKLKKLQEQGKDPYVHEKFDFTNHSVDILE